MKNNVVKEKLFAFALRIVKLSKHLNQEKEEYVLSKQLLLVRQLGLWCVKLNTLKVLPTLYIKWLLL